MGRRTLSAVLLDTHAWIWSLMDPERLRDSVKAVIREADSVHVSPISVYEIVRKAQRGQWPDVVPHLDALVEDGQTVSAPLTRAIAARAGTLDWPHRDPFDRLIAATAIELAYPLVSKDSAFDALEGTAGWEGRVWA